MLTIEDFKKLSQIFATKQDLKDLEERLVSKTEFETKFSFVIDKLDFLMGEIKSMREDWTIHSKAHDRIEEKLTKLESRSK